MDKFVIILGLLVTILISLAVLLSDYYDNKNYCRKGKGFFHRAYDYLGTEKKTNGSKRHNNRRNNSFTVPVDERQKLMYENGSNYYWSWQ